MGNQNADFHGIGYSTMLWLNLIFIFRQTRTIFFLFFRRKKLKIISIFSVGKICVIYENAVEKDGSSEELLTQLFMSYTRVNEFASQQRVAMQLFKLKQKNPYYCWAVMSCLLKAIRGTDKNHPAKRKLSLELAQRMMEKLISDNKLDAEQEAQLYLIILDQQNKYGEQLEFLDNSTGKKIYPGAPIEMRIKLMRNLKQWPELNLLLKELLKAEQYVRFCSFFFCFIIFHFDSISIN